MKYENPPLLTRAIAEIELDSGNAHRIRDALIAVALNDPDWHWVQEICLRFATSSDTSIRAICATSLGHIARIHRQLDLARVLPVLKAMTSDPETAGYAESALDDIEMFIGLS
jgi:hypothetical protein